MLVHGHWYYYRAGNLVQYFFYKNIACFTAQLYFAFFNSFSTQTLFDEMSLTMYNIIYTSIPVFLFGLFEKHFGDKTLLANPELYKTIRKNALLSPKISLFWLFDAIWSSLVTFFAFYLLFISYSNETLHDTLGMSSFGFAIYQCIVVVVNFRLLANSRYWNILLLLSIFLSLALLLCFNLTYHSFRIGGFKPSMYKVIFHVLSSPGVWLVTLLCTCVCLLPYVLMEYVHNVVRSSSFAEERVNVVSNDTENINNNISSVPEIVDNSNRINGISIIGSASSQPEFNLTSNTYKDGPEHSLSQSSMNTHNPEYAFVNAGYVEDATTEETYL